jgi:hypothetical protein
MVFEVGRLDDGEKCPCRPEDIAQAEEGFKLSPYERKAWTWGAWIHARHAGLIDKADFYVGYRMEFQKDNGEESKAQDKPRKWVIHVSDLTTPAEVRKWQKWHDNPTSSPIISPKMEVKPPVNEENDDDGLESFERQPQAFRPLEPDFKIGKAERQVEIDLGVRLVGFDQFGRAVFE